MTLYWEEMMKIHVHHSINPVAIAPRSIESRRSLFQNEAGNQGYPLVFSEFQFVGVTPRYQQKKHGNQ